MDFLELARRRYSCRRYSDKPIAKEIIERCLEAARLAPSACNSQPWSFVVVQQKEMRDQVAQAAFSGMYSMNQFAKEAQAFVLVSREDSKPAAQVGQMIQGTQYNLIDLGIACEHFILQAAEEGIGSCWIGWFNAKAVKKVLKLLSRKKVEIIISLGYPQDDTIREKNRKFLGEISEII